MRPSHPRLFVERFQFLKDIGYFLVVVGVIILTLIALAPELFLVPIVVIGYLLLGAGIILIIVNKSVEIIHQSRLRKFRVYCLNCGWSGNGAEWWRHQCCPECDSDQVVGGRGRRQKAVVRVQ